MVQHEVGILTAGPPGTGSSQSLGREAPGAGRIVVRRLMLRDFRSYAEARVAFTPSPVVLWGPNGAGKTNLLEALSFLAPGRGLRHARLSEADRRRRDTDGTLAEPAGGPWAVHARLECDGKTLEIGTGRDVTAAGERRTLLIDGEPARTQSELAHHLGVVWLTPAMDRLFTEGSSARRRFLDRLVYGFDPAHAQRVSAYEQAMRERARLLREGPQDPSWLGALEDAMASTGVAVAVARAEAVERLNQACAPERGPFPATRLALRGEVEEILARLPALAAEDELRARLAAFRQRDAESGNTALGPHRSDLEARHARTGMPAAEGSTGEQKALLIAIVLAHGRLQTALKGRAPLLLLDEVVAHLDPGRRRALFADLLELRAQAWLTGTDSELFDGLRGAAQFFTVAEARIAPG